MSIYIYYICLQYLIFLLHNLIKDIYIFDTLIEYCNVGIKNTKKLTLMTRRGYIEEKMKQVTAFQMNNFISFPILFDIKV